jgi:tetratricopeptide (TPR) repeat protein
VSGANAAPPEKLGAVSFENTCSEGVQPRLQRAVALLHSFWWSEGDKAFREVLVADPSCAIAGWGIAALAIGNPYATGPTPESAKRAQEAIVQARAIGAKSERERGYIEAVAAYYDNFAERPHAVRLRSMADAFEALAKQYPDDETQIFSAIYIVATQPPSDKTFARATQGAAILEAQFKKHPDHPGVAHYMIHAYDYPATADKGLAAAMCYADIAPSAPHALHMPSHIFTRVGLWQESASTNRRSAAAATGAPEAGDRLHALDYMVYADLQLARDDDAKAGVEEVRETPARERATTNGGAYSSAAVPARYAIERGQWAEAAKLDDPAESKFAYTDAMRYFARALGAARAGNPEAAAKDVVRLREITEALKAAKNDYWASEVEVQRISAEAWIAFAKGQRDEGLTQMRAAADLEDKSEKHPVSPGRLIPARELLGDMLLESGKPAEALAEYEASQIRDPKRFRGFWGAGQAAAQAGNKEKARYHFTKLVEMAGSADPRPELATARDYLAKN